MPPISATRTPAFAGGSYVIVQKYLHDLAGWNALPTETQERIIGRTKLSDIELDDATKPTYAHNALTIIEEGGKEIKIVRDNMPFGRVADKEFGTYFIGYARSPRTIEQMLDNMFVGRPPGNYDRLLDFSVAEDRQSVLRAVGDVPRHGHGRGARRRNSRQARNARAAACGRSATARSTSVRSKETPHHE